MLEIFNIYLNICVKLIAYIIYFTGFKILGKYIYIMNRSYTV